MIEFLVSDLSAVKIKILLGIVHEIDAAHYIFSQIPYSIFQISGQTFAFIMMG